MLSFVKKMPKTNVTINILYNNGKGCFIFAVYILSRIFLSSYGYSIKVVKGKIVRGQLSFWLTRLLKKLGFSKIEVAISRQAFTLTDHRDFCLFSKD